MLKIKEQGRLRRPRLHPRPEGRGFTRKSDKRRGVTLLSRHAMGPVRIGLVNLIGTSMLQILGRTSSINVRKVLWCCTELGLRYDREDWGAGFRSTQLPEFLRLNPNGLIPVLIDDGFVIWQSNSILRYLANQYDGHQLYPKETKIRARVDQWMDWQATDLNNAWTDAFLGLVRNSAEHRDPSLLSRSIRTWNRHMETLEEQLEKAEFVATEQLSLADIVIGLSVNRWLATPMTRPDLPQVRRYFEGLKRHRPFLLFSGPELP
jgi:glutathione S-transferase